MKFAQTYIGQFNFKGLCLNASNVHYYAFSMALQCPWITGDRMYTNYNYSILQLIIAILCIILLCMHVYKITGITEVQNYAYGSCNIVYSQVSLYKQI